MGNTFLLLQQLVLIIAALGLILLFAVWAASGHNKN